MEINIRKNIIDNFKNSNIDEIKESIISSIKEQEEITLPGLGVFFEILWQNSDDVLKTQILENIKKGLV